MTGTVKNGKLVPTLLAFRAENGRVLLRDYLIDRLRFQICSDLDLLARAFVTDPLPLPLPL